MRCAQENRFFFFSRYLPHLFTAPFGPGHFGLGKALDERAYLLVLAFRGWGKSTLVTFAETLRLLVTREVRFAVLTGRSEALTTPLVLQLRNELETNEALRRDFGPFEPGAIWQNAHFALADGMEVLGRPLGGTARGLRSLTNRRPQLWCWTICRNWKTRAAWSASGTCSISSRAWSFRPCSRRSRGRGWRAMALPAPAVAPRALRGRTQRRGSGGA